MIIETIVTTVDASGKVNIAPMGALPSAHGFTEPAPGETFLLKPFETSQTYHNLRDSRQGVLHLTDNAEWFVRGALDYWETLPAFVEVQGVNVPVLAGACSALEFAVEDFQVVEMRAEVRCRIEHVKMLRAFGGVNRALFAAIEMAILATRFHLSSPQQVDDQWQQLRRIVEKTAGQSEREALQLLDAYRSNWPSQAASSGRR